MVQEGYFAAKEKTDASGIILGKVKIWINNLERNGYFNTLRFLWAAAHGAYYDNFGEVHRITFGGEQGELTQLPVNHLRNLAQHMLTMTTSNRPTLEARSVNTDYKSLVQTSLANGLLDYYMREKRLEKYLREAVKSAIILGTGYVKMEWNATSGDVFDVNEETGAPIYQGDVEFSNLSPFDVIFDHTKESTKHDWYIVRSFKNRYDLMAKFPEFKEQILAVKPKDSAESGLGVSTFGYHETDDIAIWEFFHKRTESMPNGRYMLIISEECTPIDTALPYRDLPIYRISPDDMLGTPFGYTPLMDILPIQEGINTLYSTILSNQNAFGVQSIYVPRGADVTISSLSGGLNIIEGNSQAGEPKPLNLTNTPEEIFKFVEMLEKVAETLSGVNSVARGNPEASLKSGTALALVQSMSLQFMSGLQQQYVQLTEDVGTGLINVLKDFAAVPRVAAIVGISNRTYMKEFKGDDLEGINRVIVDLGNPLSRSTAGRVQMAEQLMQMGAITTTEQYLQIINTGKLEVMTESVTSQLLLVKGENEAMIFGKPVRVLATDSHSLHIREHSAILSDPSFRNEATPGSLAENVLAHIQEHITALQTTDPNLLGMLGQQPLSPPGGTPNAPQQPPSLPQGAPSNAPEMQQPGTPPPVTPAQMPEVPASALPNPEIQQQALGNVNFNG